MPKFSEASLAHLKTCDRDLQRVFQEVIKQADHSVICGHRGQAEQTIAFDTGKSRTPWPKSKHNTKPSLALDAAPFPIDFTDLRRLYYFAGIVKGVASQLGIKIRWGGDWDSDNDFKDQTFNDLLHYEIVL